MVFYPFAEAADAGHDRIDVRKQLVLQTQRVELSYPLGGGSAGKGTYGWLGERTIEGTIHLGYSSGGREAAIIRCVIAAQSANIFQCPHLTPHHPVAGYEIGIFGICNLAFEYCLVETGRQRIDEIDVARELIMLFSSHTR